VAEKLMHLIAWADHKYHEFVRSAGSADIAFPPFCPERRFELRPGRLLVGRRSASREITPVIDLTGPPEDASIGRAHALLIVRPAGPWSIVDLDSVNGTYLNYGPEPLVPQQAVPVGDGDVIHLGGWTSLTLCVSG
jgi:pSer/pThr/pTyr-binding forkhead associated (FHA) protein